MPHAPTKTQPDPAEVVTKAFLRATEQLELSNTVRAGILGVDRSSVTRLTQGRLINPDKRGEGENALIFLRIARSLSGLFGGNLANCKAWINAHNYDLGNRPIDLIQTLTGLVHVADYLDAMRG